jgi:hypothetical protein
MKFRTIDQIGEVTWCAKNGWNRLAGAAKQNNLSKNLNRISKILLTVLYHTLRYLTFFSCELLQTSQLVNVTLIGSRCPAIDWWHQIPPPLRSSTLWPKLLPVHLCLKVNLTALKRKMQRLCKNRSLNAQKLISLDFVWETKIVTHVKLQTLKHKADKSCQVGFKRVMADLITSVCKAESSRPHML